MTRITLLLVGCSLAAGRLAAPAVAQDEEIGLPYWVSTPPGARSALLAATGAVADRRWDEAADALQVVFDRFPQAFVRLSRGGPYTGVRHRALEVLAAAPAELRASYERRFGPRADQALREALATGDRSGLLDLVRRYEATSAGLRAILALADRALLRGRPAEARLLLARIAPVHPDAADDPAVRRRTARAAARDHAEGGPPPRADESAAGAVPLPPLQRDAWPMMGGDATRAGMAKEPVFREVRWSLNLGLREREWDQPPMPHPTYGRYRPSRTWVDWNDKWREFAPVHPVVARGFLVFSDGVSVQALNLYTGERQWRFSALAEPEEDGRTNLSVLYTPVVADGVVYAAVEVPVPHRPQTLQGIPITYYLPRRRLVALDLETGAVLWRHDASWLAGHPGSKLLERVTITGAPLVRGDHLYAGATYSEGTFHSFLVAVDRHTGELVYATRVSHGQSELNLFGRQLQEAAGTPVAEAGGVLYFGTNLGVFAAVDALLGTPLWATTYPILKIPSTFFWFEAPRRWPNFDNGPPIVAGDVVLVTPPDGLHLLAIERATGRLAWRVPWRLFDRDEAVRLRVLHGVDDERAYVSGPSAVVALWLVRDPARHAVPGRIAWRCNFARTEEVEHVGTGRGLVARNGLWIPTYETVYQIERETGKVLAIHERHGDDEEAKVNLVWGDAVLVLAGRGILCARYREDDVTRLAQRRIEDRPEAVGPLLRAADVLLATGRTGPAVEHYRTALRRAEADGLAATATRARRGLHHALLRRAEQVLEEEPGRAAAEFEAAFRAAPDATVRLRARMRLEGLLEAHDDRELEAWRLRNLRAIAKDHGDLPAGEDGGRARNWALRRVADIEAARGDVRSALAVLHRMLEADANGPDGRWASARIGLLLDQAGREVYAPYEKRASRLFDAALRSGDLEALEHGLRIYAHAASVESATLELARRYLETHHASAAARVLQHFLAERPGSSRLAEAIFLMVRALHERGAYGPAYAALLRLRNRHGEELVERADGARVRAREVARDWLERDPYRRFARSAQRRDLEPGLVRRFAKSFPEKDHLDLPELAGERPESLRDAVLLRAHDEILALHAHSGEEILRFVLAGGEPKGPLVFAAGRMLAVTARTVHVFDATDGRALGRVPVPGGGRAVRLLAHRGQVFLLYREAGLRGRAGLAALDPVDGTALWARILPAGRRDPRMASFYALPLDDRLLLFATHPVTLTVLDPTTGRIENAIPIDDERGTTRAGPPRLLPDGRVLLCLGTRHPAGRFDWSHSFALSKIDPSAPAASAVLWTYRPPLDERSRYPQLLHVSPPYAVIVDEARGAVVLDLESGRPVKRVDELELGQELGEAPDLDDPQPEHGSLLLALTRARSLGDTPARLSAFELPDLVRRYSLALTDGGRETASLVPADGVVVLRISSRRSRSRRPRIRIVDPATARVLEEHAVPATDVDWFNAAVQNGTLVVVTSSNFVYGFGPR